ncbi:MAG TPA: glycosyltransferase family 4 protein [Pyrinomonadaceae bacterium]
MEFEFIQQISREVGFGGGSECVAFELHRAWLAEGIDARIVTTNATEPEARQGIEITASWLNSLFAMTGLRHLAELFAIPLFTLIATWQVYRTKGSKIVVSHGDSLTGDVCVVHAVNRACLAEKRRGGYYAWLFNPLNVWVALRDRWMLGGLRYRRLIAISERVRTELKDFYNIPDDRIVTIPNGINLARFNPDKSSNSFKVRSSFGIPDDAKLILFVGSRFRIKGLKYAIEALAQMKTNAYLLVVGNDKPAQYKQLAEELGVNERVIFAGGRGDLPEIYPAADAFVLPTLYETFALVCLEAMASGLPVLASPVGGIEDYLIDGENGFHIRHDGQEIAQKLDVLLADPALHTKIRQAGIETAANYSWEKIANQYLNLFVELKREVGDARWTPQDVLTPKTSVSVQG